MNYEILVVKSSFNIILQNKIFPVKKQRVYNFLYSKKQQESVLYDIPAVLLHILITR